MAGCQIYGASEPEHDVARFEGSAFRLHHSRHGWLPLVWEVLFLQVIEILLRNPIRSELPVLLWRCNVFICIGLVCNPELQLEVQNGTRLAV